MEMGRGGRQSTMCIPYKCQRNDDEKNKELAFNEWNV